MRSSTRVSEHIGVSSKTGNKLSASKRSAVLTHHHLSGHNISDSGFTILTSGNSKFDLEMCESLLISKLKRLSVKQGTGNRGTERENQENEKPESVKPGT